MLYVDFIAGGNNYQLRLNTRNVVMLEKMLGKNPLAIFGNGETLPTITEMVEVLYASMQQLNHGITLDKAYDIFDAYLEDGNSATDFIPVILDIYRVSGLIRSDSEEVEEGKN